MITLSESFRALFYAPFYAALATGAYAQEGVDVNAIAPQVDGKFMSAFVRAVKPSRAQEACCGSTCCS